MISAMTSYPGQREIDLDNLPTKQIPNPFEFMPRPVTVRTGRDMRPLNPQEVNALGYTATDALTDYSSIFPALDAKQAGFQPQQAAQFQPDFGTTQFQQPQFQTQQQFIPVPQQDNSVKQAMAQMQAFVVQNQQQNQQQLNAVSQQINAISQQIANMAQVTMALMQQQQQEPPRVAQPEPQKRVRDELDSLISELAANNATEKKEAEFLPTPEDFGDWLLEKAKAEREEKAEEPEGVNIAEWEN